VIVSIVQPAYLPWLGYFDRIARSDLHVVLDHVQIDRSSKTKFANRNKVRTPEGWCWLTVPLRTKGAGDLALDALEISDDERWAERHWRTLQANYARAPHFAEHDAFFREAYARPWSRLVELCRETTAYLLSAFGIETPVVRSSELGTTSAKDDLLVEICRAVGGTTYISGPFGRDYIRRDVFEEAGIELRFHDYAHPQYEQAFPGFEPYMSAVDLLFCHGAASRAILTSGAALATA
jgi:WbqC-like protein family